MRYIGQRCLRAVLLLFGVSVLSFGLMKSAPGDYLDDLVLNPSISKATIAALRHEYGLDQAVPVQYLHWLRSAARGDWGISVAYRSPVGPLLWERAQNTLLLAGTATLAGWLLSLVAVIWAAAGRPWRGALLSGLTSFLLGLPDLLAVLGLTVAASSTGWLPVGGMTSPDQAAMGAGERFADLARHLAVPGAALVLGIMPLLLLHARAALSDVLCAPFIAAARANGIPRLRLLLRHALPAAANPLITLAGFSLGTLLSVGLLVEALAGWPGLGHLLLQSILRRDLYVVIGVVMLSAVFLAAGNLAADLLLYAADPRIRRNE
jgi:peptide/nickel transport system permease protein